MRTNRIYASLIIMLVISLLAGCRAAAAEPMRALEEDEKYRQTVQEHMELGAAAADQESPQGTVIMEEKMQEITADKEEKTPESTMETVPALPEIELKVILGPEHAQEGLVCFYRVQAKVKDLQTVQITFNRDDSSGAWGKDIAQVNLMEGERFTLICEVENDAGLARKSITLEWEEFQISESQKNEQISDAIDFSDPSAFIIDVNLTVQRVDIQYQGKVIKSMSCSGGLPETPTPTGVFQTNQKIEYSYVERFGQAAYYWTRFYGSYLFHSVPYDKEGNLQTEELAKIGSPASHGCIRLYLEDAKWMYDNLPLGVTVHIGY
jgi:hypothetical protein